MDNKIHTKFVKTAFKKVGKTDSNSIKRALGQNSKLVYGPDYTDMDSTEIGKDISRFNQYRAAKERGKKLVSPVQVKELANQMQQDFFSLEAKKKERQFRKDEEKREEALLKLEKMKDVPDDFKDELRKNRAEETKKLDEKSKGNVKKAIEEDIRHEVQDMAID